eukprot:349588-Chlamydomonas_euryale.AAC.5
MDPCTMHGFAFGSAHASTPSGHTPPHPPLAAILVHGRRAPPLANAQEHGGSPFENTPIASCSESRSATATAASHAEVPREVLSDRRARRQAAPALQQQQQQ